MSNTERYYVQGGGSELFLDTKSVAELFNGHRLHVDVYDSMNRRTHEATIEPDSTEKIEPLLSLCDKESGWLAVGSTDTVTGTVTAYSIENINSI